MKTIRMPKELLDKWLAALRSGEYEQCIGSMSFGTAYCCLGVLAHVAEADRAELERGTPSPSFMEARGILFVTEFKDDRGKPNSADCGNPYLPALGKFAACANDDGATFHEIADAIEACAEGY